MEQTVTLSQPDWKCAITSNIRGVKVVQTGPDSAVVKLNGTDVAELKPFQGTNVLISYTRQGFKLCRLYDENGQVMPAHESPYLNNVHYLHIQYREGDTLIHIMPI